ncbi:MAG: phytoene/squalene synthase family protein [Roseibacillus sp.]
MAGTTKEELGRDVLRDVSRSFYLTLRALPSGMREATSVGYLLARASDTIADCGGERAMRLGLLEDFRVLIEGGEKEGFFEEAALIADEEGVKEGERVLMRRLEEVFLWWQMLADHERGAVREVVLTIISGQVWDLEKFPEGEVVTLTDAEEAEEYCYRVAGCVGEFWTEVGFGSDEKFANKSKENMRALGKNYGKGLQLVNILRDEVEDEERGRRYLPGDREDWLKKARGFLEDGLTYSRAVRGRRARMATVLPALIGLKTIDLLERASREDLTKGVKVGRKVVKRCLLEAMFFKKA